MAAVESLQKESAPVSLPGLGRALISVGKLSQQSAEDIFRKSKANRTRFIAELTASGAVTPADLASTLSAVFGAPLLDLDAVDCDQQGQRQHDSRFDPAHPAPGHRHRAAEHRHEGVAVLVRRHR